MLYKIPKEIIVYPREKEDVYININQIVEIYCCDISEDHHEPCLYRVQLTNDTSYDVLFNDKSFLEKMISDINKVYAYRWSVT